VRPRRAVDGVSCDLDVRAGGPDARATTASAPPGSRRR
jgi:hypothetical protein